MDSPAHGARNVQIVTTGTGEALPGPVACEKSRRSIVPYNRTNREVGVEPGGRRRRP
jgi:hypothetical protein